jgi:predicted secreted protein
MAAVHGKGTAFSIGNSATLTAITSYCDNIDFPAFNVDTAETSAFGATYKSYVAGLKGGTITASGPWDYELDAIMYANVATSQPFSYTPGGASAVYTGSALITSYQVTGGMGGAVTWSASFQITGAVTRT